MASGTVISALMEMLSGFQDILGGLQRNCKKVTLRADALEKTVAALEARLSALEYQDYGWREPPVAITAGSSRPAAAATAAGEPAGSLSLPEGGR